jgi:hypothetical protein
MSACINSQTSIASGWRKAARHVEYTIDWLPVVLVIHLSVIYGFGIAPVGLKWNFLANLRHRPYAEVDFGGVLSTHSIPPGDSTINFTANAGGGLTLVNRGNETLSAGFNFSHLSCGFLCSRNPNCRARSPVCGYLISRSPAPK